MIGHCTRFSICACAALLAALPGAASAASPWDGIWALDPVRSSAEAKDAAADAYRFTIDAHGNILWEIPSIGEVVKGRIDGNPMTIRRHGAATDMTLSVVADGPWALLYTVRRNAKPFGGGRMTLVDDGKAWVDLTWPGNHARPGAFITYVKRLAGGR